MELHGNQLLFLQPHSWLPLRSHALSQKTIESNAPRHKGHEALHGQTGRIKAFQVLTDRHSAWVIGQRERTAILKLQNQRHFCVTILLPGQTDKQRIPMLVLAVDLKGEGGYMMTITFTSVLDKLLYQPVDYRK